VPLLPVLQNEHNFITPQCGGKNKNGKFCFDGGTVRSNALYAVQHAIILRKKDDTAASMFSLRMAIIIGRKHVGELTMEMLTRKKSAVNWK
jgi:hypothetical protein